jgi:plasmid stability protein
MPSITLKNLPRHLHRDLKARAKTNHRSLNKEVIATLRAGTAAAVSFDAAALEENARRARALFRRPVSPREITTWKRAGRL